MSHSENYRKSLQRKSSQASHSVQERCYISRKLNIQDEFKRFELYTVCFHKKLWKILQEMGIPDHLTCLLRNLYEVKKQQLELDMEQETGSKWEKKYVKAVYCHPTYLTNMQSSFQFNCSVVSDSLRPHESQHARPHCPSPTPRVYSNSCP